MRFISPAQRKAVMARIMTGKAAASRFYKKGTQIAVKGYHATPNWVKAGAGLGALAAVTSPSVSHFPTRLGAVRGYGPFLAGYALAPAAGYLAAQHAKGKKISRVIQQKKHQKAMAGMALTGLGAFFGGRAIVHTWPALMPVVLQKKIFPAKMFPHGYPSAMNRILKHGVPLGALGAGFHVAGKQLGKKSEEVQHAAARTPEHSAQEFGTNYGTFAIRAATGLRGAGAHSAHMLALQTALPVYRASQMYLTARKQAFEAALKRRRKR